METTTTTTLAPTPTYEYAGFWARFAAVFIDGLIMIIPAAVLNWALPIAGSILVGIMYKPFFESSALQATPGKVIMGLKVMTEDGSRISFKQSLIRYLGYIASSAICCIGFLFLFFTKRKQTMHDLIAETIVVKEVSPDVGYIDAWVDEVQRVFKSNRVYEPSKPSTSTGSVTTQLEELHQLFSKGIITEEEFNRKKEELLKRI